MGQPLAGVATACARHARLVCVLAVLGAALALVYTARNVRFTSDRDALISPELDFKRAHADLLAAFPGLRDDLVLVLDAPTPESARAAALELARRLERSDLFQSVRVPRAAAFLERHALLYMETGELAQLVQRLAEAQPFLGRLARDPSLRGLFDMLAEALAERARGRTLELDNLLAAVDAAGRAALDGRAHATSWLELLQGPAADHAARRQLVLLQVQRDFGALFPGRAAIAAARAAARELERSGVRVRMTGELFLADEELASVQRGAERIAVVVLLCVGVLLYAGLRSWRMVLATLATLIVGLALTAAFATAAVGHLNLISIVFAALYLGLGVDYAIHLCLRLADSLAAGEPLVAAVRSAVAGIGGSLVVCALTTAAGFFAFVPTAYRGVSELGLIAGTGMFISLAVTLTVLPAALALVQVRAPPHAARRAPAALAFLTALPFRHRTAVRLVTGALALGALALVPRARFDANPLNLRDANAESVATFRDLLASSATPPWSLHALAPDRASARALAQRLAALGGRVVWLGSFVPADQEPKLELLADAALLLGTTLEPTEHVPAPDDAQRRAALERLLRAGPQDGLAETLAELARRAPHAPALLARLEQSLVGELGTTLDLLDQGLASEGVEEDDLPPELVSQWVATDGRQRVEVFAADDLDPPGAMHAFVDAVTAVAPNATGAPLTIVRSAAAIVGAFRQALAWAFVAIAVVLALLLRRARDVLAALVTLILCGLLTCASAVALGLDFDFANVIALPLLLGIGVDAAVHVLHRRRAGRALGEAPEALLRTSTARGIVFSAATTFASFANLATSAHPGTAGMGLLLTLGFAWTLIVALLALPACLPSARESAPLG